MAEIDIAAVTQFKAHPSSTTRPIVVGPMLSWTKLETTIVDPANDPEITLQEKDRGEQVRQALNQLSLQHRKIIDLVYYHEKSIEECAQVLGIPAATVKTRMFYARKKLAELVARPCVQVAAAAQGQTPNDYAAGGPGRALAAGEVTSAMSFIHREQSDTDEGGEWVPSSAPKGRQLGRPMSKAAREYHLIDLAVGISHGGFESLAGARQFARQEGLSAWDIFHGNDRIEYHDPHDREMSEVKAKQDLWMCMLLNAPMHHAPS